jgi:hypothetical protein
MKFQEVLNEYGSFPANASSMMNPATSGVAQLVQPTTIQAQDPSQSWTYDKAKEQNKKDTKIRNLKKYNKKETDKLSIYYDDEENETDKKFRELTSKIDKKIAARAGLINMDSVSK